MSGLLSDNPEVMASLLAALSDPGQITPRAQTWPAQDESLTPWQRRAVIEHAAPYIQAAEREHICQLMSEEAERLTRIGHPQHGSALRNFAELIGERERQLQQVWTAIRDLGGAQ